MSVTHIIYEAPYALESTYERYQPGTYIQLAQLRTHWDAVERLLASTVLVVSTVV